MNYAQFKDDYKTLYTNPFEFFSNVKKAQEEGDNDGDMDAKKNTILIYGPILSENLRVLFRAYLGNDMGIVSGLSFSQELEEMDGDITIRINSPGGFVNEAAAMATQLAEYGESQGEVTCVIDGACYSAAILPYLSAPLANRRVGQSADALIHKPMTSVIGGNDVELMKAASDLQKYETTLIEFISENTTLSEAKTRKMMAAETFLQPKELVKMGFAESIVKTPKTKKAERKEEAKSTEEVRAEGQPGPGPHPEGDTKDEHEARLAFEKAEKRMAELNAQTMRLNAIKEAEKRMIKMRAGSVL